MRIIGRKQYIVRNINYQNMINVRISRCHHEGCESYAMFGSTENQEEGEIQKRYCQKHRSRSMILKTRRKCKHIDCNKEREYCSEHKLLDMINLKSIICKHDDCKTIASFGYDNGSEISDRFCSKHKLPDMINLKEVTTYNIIITKQ